MHCIVAHEYGPPEHVLTYEEVDKPTLEPASVLVRMQASTINPSDLIPVTGAYRHRTRLPFVPGYDGVGVVTEAGRDVDPALLGRRVLPLGSPGNWQSCKAVPAAWCVQVPDDIGDEQAAVAYVNPLTAQLMVNSLPLQAGDRIGITAGASTIGRMLIRLLASAGARPIAIVRSDAARGALRREPVEVVQDGAALPELAAGLDAVGGPSGAHLAASIRPGGPMIHYGLLSGEPLTGALLAAAETKAAVRLFRLRDWVHEVPRATLHATMVETFNAIRTGLTASAIAGHYPLPAFRDALSHDARPGRQGKIILHL